MLSELDLLLRALWSSWLFCCRHIGYGVPYAVQLGGLDCLGY